MGTRADFYIGKGPKAEWLGSTAWDGYPGGVFVGVEESTQDEGRISRPYEITSEEHWRAEVERFFAGRDDVTLPDDGWPWPWNDSNTTDYAYTFDEGKVWGNCFGDGWVDVTTPTFIEGEDGADDQEPWDIGQGPTDFPDMTERKSVARGQRSGTIMIGFTENGSVSIK